MTYPRFQSTLNARTCLLVVYYFFSYFLGSKLGSVIFFLKNLILVYQWTGPEFLSMNTIELFGQNQAQLPNLVLRSIDYLIEELGSLPDQGTQSNS